jgi:hypothetical protein
MAHIVDNNLERLLQEAENRLQDASATGAKAPKMPSLTTTAPPIPPLEKKKKDDLHVREVHRPSAQQSKDKDTAGANWFDLPKTDPTPELKREWQLLRMRSLLDPKHQKKALRATLPEYSQVGEIIAGPTEFYSARLTRKERKRTLLEEAMSSHDPTKLREKYAGIQRVKSSGKKAFYEKVKSQRRKRRG